MSRCAIGAAIMATIFNGVPTRAAAIAWDAGSGWNQEWSTATNWSLDTVPGSADNVLLPDLIPGGQPAFGAPYVITLSSGELANALTINNTYKLSGGSLALTSGNIAVGNGYLAVINSQLSGTTGLTLTGTSYSRGALRLTNAASSYTGTTTINSGTLVVTNSGALGTDTSAVIVNAAGVGSGATIGGGTLVVDGGTTGISFSRALNLTGTGNTSAGFALINVGNNTYTGRVTTTGTTQITSAFGLLSLADLSVSGTARFGEARNIGNVAITGRITGTGLIENAGSGTVILNPTDATTYSGVIRATSGTIRVTSAAALGTNAGLLANSTIDVNGGTFEFRLASPTVGKSVVARAGGTLYFDRAIGAGDINTAVSFGATGALTVIAGTTATFSGRSGYGVTFAGSSGVSGDGAMTITNNLNGLLTFSAATFYNGVSLTAQNFTFGGSGDTLVSGNIVGTGGAHALIKTGTGTLTLNGTAATFAGATSVQNGTLAINDFRAINNTSTAAINLGNATATGTLTIGTATGTPNAADLTTGRPLALTGAGGDAVINANQSIASPVVFSSTAAIAVTNGAKSFTLGGTNTQDNAIWGIIQDSTAKTSLIKTDAGTWLLTGANTYTGNTAISGGTLKLQANAAASTIIANGSALVFNTNATTLAAGGTLEFLGFAGAAATEALGALTPTAGAGTIKLTGVSGGSASLTFASLGAVSNGTGVNIDASASGGGAVTITGVATTTATTLLGNGHLYLNGADFARSVGGLIVAPVYGTDIGFSAATTALTAATHNSVTSNIVLQPTVNISSLKLTGSSLTLLSGNTLQIRLTANTSGGILATAGVSSIDNGSITTSGSGDLVVRVDQLTDQLTIGSTIAASTTGGLTKNGLGTLILGGTNLQTGAITINEGTLKLNPGATLGALTAAGSNGTILNIRQGGTLDLNGVGSINAVGSLNGAGTITNGGASAATLEIGNLALAAGSGNFTGLIQDGAATTSLRKIGSGNQTLSGLNTYTGTTYFDDSTTGSLSVTQLADIGNASSIGKGNVANNSGSLVFSGTFARFIYTGTTSVSTNRLFTLAGSSDQTGVRLLNSSPNNSSLIFSNTGAIAFDGDALHVLALGGTSLGDSRIELKITDSGFATRVVKFDSNLWILGNIQNTYTGETAIGGGALQAIDGFSLPAKSTLTFSGGVLQSSGSFTRTLGGGESQFSWFGSGGFAASVAKLNVNWGSTPTWGDTRFLAGTNSLILSSPTALFETEILSGFNIPSGATATIQVDDNTSTFTDFATISGVIGGDGSVVKSGAGLLQLLGANTYAGSTTVSVGTLVVTSIGHSALGGASSVGTATGANQLSHALLLGNGGTGPGILQYVGPGETSDRYILINTTSGNTQIVADGSGPLVLTNVVNGSLASSRNLYLRGSNTFGNQITSDLTDGGGVLTIQKDTAATWILSGNNTFTGPVNVTAGSIGVGGNGAFGVAGVRFLNAANFSVFAYGADRTIASPAAQLQNSTLTIVGDYNLTFGSQFSIQAANANQIRWTNNIAAGKTLTIAGNLVRTDAGTNVATSLLIDGTGDALISGNIINSNPTPLTSTWGLTYSGTGTLALSGAANTYNGPTAITSGTLKLAANEVIPNGSTAGSVTLGGAGTTATLDLNGRNETINALTATAAGTIVIDNTSPLPATLTLGDNNGAVTFAPATGGIGRISNSGGGPLSISKIGTGSATIGNSLLTYTGTTSVSGGSLTIASPQSGTTGLSVAGGGTLALNGGLGSPDSILSVIAAGGTTLDLWDGLGTPISLLTTLNLGAGSGLTTLNLDLGAQADLLISNSATVANSIGFNLRAATGFVPGNTYTLLSAPSGFALGNFLLSSTPSGYTPGTLNITDSLISYTAGSAIAGTFYWNNVTGNGSWAYFNLGNTNWKSDAAGTLEAGLTPGAASTVIFSTSNVGTGTLTTTLDADFTVNDLSFTANAPDVTSMFINSGTPVTNTLNIRPSVPTLGINVAADAGNITIGARVNLSGDQSWTIDGTGNSSLTVSGNIGGPGSLTKSGAGILTLSGANTFSAGLTIARGTTSGLLSAQAFGAGTITLGATTGTNSATLQVGTSGFTFTNPIMLATNAGVGLLTIGTSGNPVSATFSGGVIGTNNLTINSNGAAGTITFAANPINISGTITNTGAGTGTTLISGGIGPNVTEIILNSTTSALTISKVGTSTLTVNPTVGTTLTNLLGVRALTVSSGVTGVGDLYLKNNGAGNNLIVLQTNPVNNSGKIINVGTGQGTGQNASVQITGGIGPNVTEISQRSATSGLVISTTPITVSPVGITLTNTGVVGPLTLSAGTIGTGDLFLNHNGNTGVFNATVTALNHVGRVISIGGGTGNTSITGGIGPNITDVIQRSLTSQLVINTTPITVNGTVGTTLSTGTGSTARLTVNAGTTGTGDLTLQNNGGTTGGITLATNSVNHTGRLINAGTNGGTAAINAVIGTAVTEVVQNGASPLVLSGVNTYSGPTNIVSGTLQLTAAGSINSSPLISIGNGGIFNVAAVVGYAPAVGQTLAAYGTGIATVTGAVNAVDRTLDMQSGAAIGRLNFSTGLTLGNSTLKFDLNQFESDRITIAGLATLTGVTLNTIDLATISGTTQLTVGTRAYTLVASTGGWNDDFFQLASSTVLVNGLLYGVSLSADSRNQYLDVTAPLAPDVAYWKGDIVGSGTPAGRFWNSVSETTFETNFTLADGSTNIFQDPTSTTNIFFAGTGNSADLATSLGRSYSVNSLNFLAADPVVIAGGQGIALTLNGSAGVGNPAGRAIHATSTAGPVVISSDIVVAANQYWQNDSANPLTIPAGTVVEGNQVKLTIQGTGPVVIDGSLNLFGGNTAAYEFKKLGTGTLTLTGVNNYNVPTNIAGGVLEVVGNGTLGDGNGNITIGDTAVLRMNHAAGIEKFVSNAIMNDPQPGAIGGRFVQAGAGTTIVTTNNNLYTGTFEVDAGTLVAPNMFGNPLYSARSITVGTGSSQPAALIVAGTATGAITVRSGGTLSPGASMYGNHEEVGTFQANSSVSLAAGSSLTFQFTGGLHPVGSSGDVTAADHDGQLNAAYSGSWDLLAIGTLDLTGVSESGRINLKLVSMSDVSTQGSNSGFLGTSPLGDGSTESLHWLFATTSTVTRNGQAITGDINDYFHIDTSGVVAAGNQPLEGSFYVSRVGGDLYLNYTAVPEPGSLVLIGVAGIGWALRRRYALFSRWAPARGLHKVVGTLHVR